MVSIFDVAKYILEERGRMSVWKLQALCYYSQAWHYTWTGKRLIKEKFQAWRNGAICPELYYKHVGKYRITTGDIFRGNPKRLDEDESDSVDVLLHDYGDFPPYQLHEMVISETPWKSARGDTPEYKNSDAEITLESMGKYYQEVLKSKEVRE